MNILAIETSGRIITVALQTENSYTETVLDIGYKHAETLMPAIDSVFSLSTFSPDKLDLAVCSAGPGSFTALRIGMSTIKGIARGAGCPFKSVPVLPVLAEGREYWNGIVMPLMDARKNRVYTAAFENGRRIAEDTDTDLDNFISSLPSKPILATGADARIAENYPNITIDPLYDSGRGKAIIKKAAELFEKEGPDPVDAGPLYLRLSEAEEALKKKNGKK